MDRSLMEKKLETMGFVLCQVQLMWNPDDNTTYSVNTYAEGITFPRHTPTKTYVLENHNHLILMSGNKSLFDEFEEFLKSFDIELDDNDVDIAKAKKPDPMYCNCDKPNIVKRGFSHIAYDYCKTCRKEKVSE